MKLTTHLHVALALLLLVGVGLRLAAMAQEDSVPAPLNTEQVVDKLVHMDAERAQSLRSYQGKRIYRLVYSGFPAARSAEMIVDVKYQSPTTKEFVIVSVTGSKVVIDRVFKKLLQSEKEALAENPQRTALNEANYVFTLLAYEVTPGAPMYVLSVEPRRKDKFLYSGKIWVDAGDFAVVRIEAQPAKNPSFWIRNTKIEQLYLKVNDFWLPARNHSLTSVRLGGRAELTIDYQDYQVVSESLPGKISDATPHGPAKASRGQQSARENLPGGQWVATSREH